MEKIHNTCRGELVDEGRQQEGGRGELREKIENAAKKKERTVRRKQEKKEREREREIVKESKEEKRKKEREWDESNYVKTLKRKWTTAPCSKGKVLGAKNITRMGKLL